MALLVVEVWPACVVAWPALVQRTQVGARLSEAGGKGLRAGGKVHARLLRRAITRDHANYSRSRHWLTTAWFVRYVLCHARFVCRQHT